MRRAVSNPKAPTTPPEPASSAHPPGDAAASARTPAVAPPKSVAWQARAAGVAVVVLGLGLLLWVAVLFSVEIRFRTLTVSDPEQPRSAQALEQYGHDLEKLLRLDPTHGEMHARYAHVLAVQRNFAAAREQMTLARRTLNTQDALFFLADINEKLGDLETAQKLMAQSIQINPTHVQYNTYYLRLLLSRLQRMEAEKKNQSNPAAYDLVHREFGRAALAWAVRAPHEPNAWLFLGNMYVSPRALLQSYRCFLQGFSNPDWLGLHSRLMISPRQAIRTVHQIINGRFAKPHLAPDGQPLVWKPEPPARSAPNAR